MGKKQEPKEPKKQSEVSKAAKGFFYGMALHGMVTYALRLRMHMENLFMLITMGDMLGIPVLPPYYSLRYILFGGKGGLRKTTLSAATAHWLARRGKRVCVFSTDPQASLSDIFERKIFGQGEVELASNLYAVEIDADRRIAEYQEEIRNKIKDMYKMETIPEEVEDYINSSAAEPAMAESATFDAMVELMTAGKFDYYVFDMMPHGHAIRFLGMADILDQWVEKIVSVRKKAGE